LEEDLDNEIWVGTAEGPAVFYQSASVFDDDINASQILISQDGNLQYLLETEVIQSIIIDAGNRKWLGTQSSGVFVLSADGLTTDHHFTRENSPLPSNDILDIAMDYASGEVYIATSTGLVSYRAEATNWDREMENVRVMPNPIRADHTGPIVFDGMAFNSTVHITDATGQRIEVLESNGGRATWDGVMENGQPAPYGVYLAFATDSEGKKGRCDQIRHPPMKRSELPSLPSSKMPNVGTTIFTEMSALAKTCGALNMAQGFPDLATPKDLRNAAREAMENGHNQYAPMAGECGPSWVDAHSYHQGMGYDPENEITIGAGASSVLFAAMTALLRAGDEVVVQDPCYDLYAPVAELQHARVVKVPLVNDRGEMNADGLASAINQRTRLVILNSPHNPTGMVTTEAVLDALAIAMEGPRLG
jgi:hypothetical protein